MYADFECGVTPIVAVSPSYGAVLLSNAHDDFVSAILSRSEYVRELDPYQFRRDAGCYDRQLEVLDEV